MNEEKDILMAIQQQRTQLEQDVEMKQKALAESEERLSAFRANALSALGAASGSKSAQKQRAERQAVVAQLLSDGLSRAEIVRRTGLADHLVGYDIDCIRKRRAKQGTKRVMAKANLPRVNLPRIDDPGTDGSRASIPSADGLGVGSPILGADDAEDADVESVIVVPSASAGIPTNDLVTDLQDDPVYPSPPEDGEELSVNDDDDSGDFGATMKNLETECKRRGSRSKGPVLFYTTKDYGHRHIAELSSDGYGRTREVNEHSHAVNMFDVRQAKDHEHGLTLEPMESTAFVPGPSAGPGKPGVMRPGCAASRDQVKAAMKDYRRGKRRSSTFRTTRDNDHEHTVLLDNMGDGETVDNDGTKHKHRVCRFELIEGSHDHSHGLTLAEDGEKK